MIRITNDNFDAREKAFLEFVFRQDFPGRDRFLEQLARMKPEDLVRDVTPFYWILEFRPAMTRAGYKGMRPVVTITTGEPIPTIFTLYQRDGRIFELEIYHADSSEFAPDGLIRELMKEREE